jgi:hypothetical protein
MKFKITQIESTGSPLYNVQAIDGLDAEGKDNILMTWHIAAPEGSDIEALALEGYNASIAPPVILPQE